MKPIPAGFKAQPRDTAMRASPITSANMENAAIKSSIAGVNPSDPMSVYSCAKDGIGSRINETNIMVDMAAPNPKPLGDIETLHLMMFPPQVVHAILQYN